MANHQRLRGWIARREMRNRIAVDGDPILIIVVNSWAEHCLPPDAMSRFMLLWQR